MSDNIASPKQGHAIVEFYEDHTIDPVATREAGRPVSKPRELCRIRFTNNMRQESVFLATDVARPDPHTGAQLTYAQVYEDEYRRFKQRQQEIGEGTLIEMAQFLTSARVAEMKAMGINTIDALAAIPQGDANKLGPNGTEEVKQAKQYLKESSSLANNRKLASENEALRQAKADLEKRVEELNAELTKKAREAA